MAENKVKPSAIKKSKVEITREAWNMLFNCFKGPTKNEVLFGGEIHQ